MGREDWLLAAGVFGACFTVGALYILYHFAGSANAAAWVQAIGAVLAILVAIYFARSDRADRKRSEERKAYSLVGSLTGSIFLMDMEVSRVERVIGQYRNEAPSAHAWQQWFKSGRIDIPSPLSAAMPMMQTSENEMVGRFRTITMLAHTFNAHMEKFSTLDRNESAEKWAALYQQIAGQVELIRKTLDSITAMDKRPARKRRAAATNAATK
jgi:hypothetical protein